MLNHVEFFGNVKRARALADSFGPDSRFLFALVMSYTVTCETPGISAAGATPASMRLTPAADAEYIRYGHCKSIDGVPMTPDGLPTPALLTRTALEAAHIPSMTINAGGVSHPKLPYVETGLSHGEDIAKRSAMTDDAVKLALKSGYDAGRHAADVSECVIIGESVPGGTTTALGVMRGLGIDARVSSSMMVNPTELKDQVVNDALTRISGNDAHDVLRELGDPMLGFVCAMASSASQDRRVLFAGGTQMLAAFLLARRLCDINEDNVALATTTYIARDNSANFTDIARTESIPVMCVDPHLESSKTDGLCAFSRGHAKEGAGAGGAITAAILKGSVHPDKFCTLAESEYARVLSHSH